MRRFILPLLLTVTLLLAACAPTQFAPPPPVGTSQMEPQPVTVSTEPTSPSGGLARSDGQGSVTVEVTPLNLDAPAETLEFNVLLDTHSVDLSMDLATLATLTTDTGITLQAIVWDAPRGGHHVEGKLVFPAMKDGNSILEGADKLTLTITNVDAPTRVFEWQL